MELRRIAIVIYAVLALPVIFQIGYDLSYGGDPYRQGDWLINWHETVVRRGVVGSLLIWFSDLTGFRLLTVAAAVPLALYIALLATVCSLLPRAREEAPLYLLLISAGFCLVGWGGDPSGALRKEVIALLALALIVRAAGHGGAGWIPVGLACALMVLGAGGHLIVVLTGPVVIAAGIVAMRQGRIGPGPSAVLIAATALAMAAGAILVLGYGRLSSPWPVCRPLLDRGIPEQLCTGSVAALAMDRAGIGAMVAARLTGDAMREFAVVLMLVLAPVGYFIALCRQKRRAIAALAFCAVWFLPLYLLAEDWGRWLIVQISCFGLLAVLMVRAGLLDFERRPDPRVVAVVALGGLLAPPFHVIGINLGGGFADMAQIIVSGNWGAPP